jgi:hypothetical protein
MMRKRTQLIGAAVSLAVSALLTTGCGGTGSTAVVRANGTDQPPSKHFAQGTGDLKVGVTPSSGPAGTEVTIHGVGCGDPDGQNHAVSFNPDVSTAGTSNVRNIPSTLSGQSITASYVISADDAALAGDAAFFVQCATDLAQVSFNITS